MSFYRLSCAAATIMFTALISLAAMAQASTDELNLIAEVLDQHVEAAYAVARTYKNGDAVNQIATENLDRFKEDAGAFKQHIQQKPLDQDALGALFLALDISYQFVDHTYFQLDFCLHEKPLCAHHFEAISAQLKSLRTRFYQDQWDLTAAQFYTGKLADQERELLNQLSQESGSTASNEEVMLRRLAADDLTFCHSQTMALVQKLGQPGENRTSSQDAYDQFEIAFNSCQRAVAVANFSSDVARMLVIYHYFGNRLGRLYHDEWYWKTVDQF